MSKPTVKSKEKKIKEVHCLCLKPKNWPKKNCLSKFCALEDCVCPLHFGSKKEWEARVLEVFEKQAFTFSPIKPKKSSSR